MDTDPIDNGALYQAGMEQVKYGVSRIDLEASGLDTIRKDLRNKKYHNLTPQSFSFVSDWVAEKEDELRAADSARRDAREAETLSIAREANRLASEANSIARLEAAAASRSARYAMYASIVAVIGAITANKTDIFDFIKLLLK
jgi:hypothetical protein